MFKKTAKGHAKGHAKFPVPASNPCPNGTCKTKPHAPVAPLHPLHVKTAYNACGFGTPYVCGAEEAQARGTNDPLVAAMAGMGPLTTCVFPGGGCTSTSLGACILGGGQVQSSGCCPGVTCIQAHVPGFVSEGCDKLPPNAVKHYGASAKLERRAVADVMGLLDQYTFGDLTRGGCRMPPHHHHRSHGLTPGVFDGSAVVHPAAGGFTPGVFDGSAVVRPAAGGFTPGVFDGSAVVRPSGGGGGASAAVAPVFPAMPGMPTGGFAFPAFSAGGGTSIYAPIVVPNNSGTVSIVNTQTAGPGARPPAVIPGLPPNGGGKSAASGSVFPGPGSAFIPGPGPVIPAVPGSGSVFVGPSGSGSVPVMPPFVPGPGRPTGPVFPNIPGIDFFSVDASGNFITNPVAPPLIPTPYSYSPGDIIDGSNPIPLVPVPGPSPAVNTGGGVPAVPLSAIHFGNKRGVKTAISSVVAGARSGSAVLAHPRHMAHGTHTKLKKSAKTLPTDGLVVMIDGADDTGAAVGGVFHIPVGALLADQIYTVPPTMASSSHGHKCALQAKRHGSSLYLDLF